MYELYANCFRLFLNSDFFVLPRLVSTIFAEAVKYPYFVLFSIFIPCLVCTIVIYLNSYFQSLPAHPSGPAEDQTPVSGGDVLKRYGFTHMGVISPSSLLPAYYEPWEILGFQLASLNEEGRCRQAMNALPLLEPFNLQTEQQLRRAFVLLSSFTSSYMNIHRIHTHLKPATVLPVQIARPFLIVCERLQIASPVVIHAGHDLWNFSILDSTKPISVDNIKLTTPLLLELDSHYFHLLVTLIHYHARYLFVDVLQIRDIAERGDKKRLRKLLFDVRDCFTLAAKYIGMFYSKVKRDVFFNKYRHLLQGYSVDFDLGPGHGKKHITVKGGSAAQSLLLQMIDIVFNINHTPCATSFYNEMREGYMPKPHQIYLKDVGNLMEGLTLKGIATQHGLGSEFNQAVLGIKKFRRAHTNLALHYILHGKKGTGETDFEKFLEGVHDATVSCMG